VSFWTPPTVSPRLSEETARREAEAQKAFAYERKVKWVEDFNRDLENIWSGMRLVWCPDPAPVEAVAMGARPGRWGILMPSKDGGPSSVKPIVGPDGCFVDPSVNASAIFESLREQDWWNPQVMRERERVKVEAERAAERRKEQEREERTQEILERWLAVSRAQVSMSSDSPWSQNAAGKRGAKQ
jgi:hypothetical protein